ncbi:MAG: hypothetical protein J0M33_23820 [Anaerolineae bacterium]|nr:hypothetical protein [Anaerolineae bacterium]
MTPTPTPTPGPTGTPTPLWATPWATPTTRSIEGGEAGFSIGDQETAQGIAEEIVGSYNYVNALGVMDLMWFALVVFIAVGGTWTVIKRLQKLGD